MPRNKKKKNKDQAGESPTKDEKEDEATAEGEDKPMEDSSK